MGRSGSGYISEKSDYYDVIPMKPTNRSTPPAPPGPVEYATVPEVKYGAHTHMTHTHTHATVPDQVQRSCKMFKCCLFNSKTRLMLFCTPKYLVSVYPQFDDPSDEEFHLHSGRESLTTSTEHVEVQTNFSTIYQVYQACRII